MILKQIRKHRQRNTNNETQRLINFRKKKTNMTKVLLIRHGETDGNRTRTMQVPETPLNERGFNQAAKLGERVAKEFHVHRIICSDLERAMNTAQAVSKTTGKSLELSSLLQERSVGDLRGKKYDDLMKNGIRPFDPEYCPPNGESLPVFAERVNQAWEFVLACAETVPEGKVLAVVTHGLVLDYLARNHLDIDESLKKETHLAFRNTSVTLVDVSQKLTNNTFPIVGRIFNDDSHLSKEDKDERFVQAFEKISKF